jgi:hypothetical protein
MSSTKADPALLVIGAGYERIGLRPGLGVEDAAVLGARYAKGGGEADRLLHTTDLCFLLLDADGALFLHAILHLAFGLAAPHRGVGDTADEGVRVRPAPRQRDKVVIRAAVSAGAAQLLFQGQAERHAVPPPDPIDADAAGQADFPVGGGEMSGHLE